VIDNAEKYAEGRVHVNGIENFWSPLKRRTKGTYVSVEPFHLFRNLDEQVSGSISAKAMTLAGSLKHSATSPAGA
jgi:hypothetical protein